MPKAKDKIVFINDTGDLEQATVISRYQPNRYKIRLPNDEEKIINEMLIDNDAIRKKIMVRKLVMQNARDIKAFNNRVKRYRHTKSTQIISQLGGDISEYNLNFITNNNVMGMFAEVKDEVLRLLRNASQRGIVHFQLRLYAEFFVKDVFDMIKHWVNSTTQQVDNADYETAFLNAADQINKTVNCWVKDGYEWEFSKVLRCEMQIRIVGNRVGRGGDIKSPKKLVDKRAALNIKGFFSFRLFLQNPIIPR